MMQKLVALFIILNLLFITAPFSEDKLINNNEFVTDLFRNTVKFLEKDDNLIMSPASIFTLLGLTYFGAKGETAKEIERSLHLPYFNKKILANKFKSILSISESPESIIKIANKIYVNKGIEIKSDFGEISKNFFKSDIENLDFSKTLYAINTINNWVQLQTNNTIKNLIDGSNLNANMDLILINTINFKGEWEISPQSQKMLFHNNGEVETNIVDCLFVKDYFKFANIEELDAKVTELPYKNSNFSLLILLPNFNDNLSSLLEKFSDIDLIEITKQMPVQETTIKIPKFIIESKLELENILKSMGMKTMFSNSAEFKFLDKNVSISQVVTKALIDVNEVGTNATAASSLVGKITQTLSVKMTFQIFTILVSILGVTLSASTGSTDIFSNGEFTSDLFAHITKDEKTSNGNLVFSPASIQTCLALAFFGAEISTADELAKGLHFNSADKDVVAKQFENMLQIARGPKSLMKLANKIFANKEFEVKSEFNEVARKSFESEAETLDFADSKNSVSKINEWVSNNTNNKIQNLVDESVISPETKMVLVNAIHFKGNWKIPLLSREGEFFNDGTTETKANMMFIEDDFLYSDLDDLNAKAVKIPYANSDLSMLLILPTEKTGIHGLEEKLKTNNLIEIANNMVTREVAITLPKFQIESKFDLNKVLENMGMKEMFTDDAKFNFFKSTGASKIGKVLHKAFIDVNESGTEAAASTGLTIVPTSLNLNMKYFYADHPFFFAIVDNANVYFSGHLTRV
ncbi:uncharacterized protein LOC129610854 [Condylostylus longicornis]|uniref:uncharacterized protein LOC129610854 n=1 Tax=Condylostylus longicornis TaxID=2530218 RepID=UPI00244DAC4F|nr:uncharacterized protein LOC129610854 [Condylostylus longicornis]